MLLNAMNVDFYPKYIMTVLPCLPYPEAAALSDFQYSNYSINPYLIQANNKKMSKLGKFKKELSGNGCISAIYAAVY